MLADGDTQLGLYLRYLEVFPESYLRQRPYSATVKRCGSGEET
jgi:hypothetical protein